MLFICVTLTDSEPWIELNAGRSAPAFQHSLPLVNCLLVQRPFTRPTSAQIAQCVMRGRERESRSRSLIDHDWLRFMVFNCRRACDDTRFGIDSVVQRHDHCAADV